MFEVINYLYYICVNFMINIANFSGVTYKDMNIIVLFGILPVILLLDFIILVRSVIAYSKRSQ